MASPIAWLITIGTTCSVRPSTILTSKAAPRSKETRSRTRAISFSQVFTYARLPLERMKSSVAIDIRTSSPAQGRPGRGTDLGADDPAGARGGAHRRAAGSGGGTNHGASGEKANYGAGNSQRHGPQPRTCRPPDERIDDLVGGKDHPDRHERPDDLRHDLRARRHPEEVVLNGGSRDRRRHGQGRSVQRNQHEVRQHGRKPMLRVPAKIAVEREREEHGAEYQVHRQDGQRTGDVYEDQGIAQKQSDHPDEHEKTAECEVVKRAEDGADEALRVGGSLFGALHETHGAGHGVEQSVEAGIKGRRQQLDGGKDAARSLRPDGEHSRDEEILHENSGQLRVVACGHLQTFLKENLEEKKSPENGAEGGIDHDEVLTSSCRAAQRRPDCREQVGYAHRTVSSTFRT